VLFNFARITAGSFGTSITTTVWDRRATLHHAQLIEHLTPNDPVTAQALGNLHAGGVGPDQSYALLNRMVDAQAFMLSADDIFYVSGLLFPRPDRARVAGAPGARRPRRRVLLRGPLTETSASAPRAAFSAAGAR